MKTLYKLHRILDRDNVVTAIHVWPASLKQSSLRNRKRISNNHRSLRPLRWHLKHQNQTNHTSSSCVLNPKNCSWRCMTRVQSNRIYSTCLNMKKKRQGQGARKWSDCSLRISWQAERPWSTHIVTLSTAHGLRLNLMRLSTSAATSHQCHSMAKNVRYTQTSSVKNKRATTFSLNWLSSKARVYPNSIPKTATSVTVNMYPTRTTSSKTYWLDPITLESLKGLQQ